MAKPTNPKKKPDAKRAKEKAAESGVSTAQRVFGKVLEKADPKDR
jgi:hypothetical protein